MTSEIAEKITAYLIEQEQQAGEDRLFILGYLIPQVTVTELSLVEKNLSQLDFLKIVSDDALLAAKEDQLAEDDNVQLRALLAELESVFGE